MKRLGGFLSSKPVFVRILVLIFIFSFPPIILGSIVYYKNASTKLIEEYKKNDKNLVIQGISAIELIMDTIINASNQIYYDEEFIRLLRQHGTLNEFEKEKTGSSMSALKNSSKYISSVYLNSKSSNLIYSTEYGYSTPDRFPDREFIKANSNATGETILTGNRNIYESFFQMNPSKTVITMTRILPVSYGFNNEQLIININSALIYNDIIKKLELESTNEMMILNKDKEIVFCDNNSKLLSELLNNGTISSIIESGVSHREVFRDNDKYLVTFVHSPTYVWDYIWISPFTKIIAVQNSIRNIIIIYSILLQIFIFIIGVLVINRTAKPIDELLREISYKKDSSRVGFNIFSFISNYIRTMIKSNDELKNKLNMVIPVYKNQYLMEMLTQKNIDPKNAADRLKEFDIIFETGSFYVATLQILNLNGILREGGAVNVLKFSMAELICASFENSNFNTFVVNIDDEKTSIIFNERNFTNEKSKTLLYNGIKNLCSHIHSRTNIMLAVGISENGRDITDLHKLYSSSIKALQYRTLDTLNPIIFIDEMKDMNMVSLTDYCMDYEEKLHTFVATGNEDEAVKIIKHILEHISHDKNMTKSYFDSQLLQLTSMIMRIAGQINIDITKEFFPDNNPITALAELSTLQETKIWFERLLVSLCRKSKETRKDIEHFNLQRILRFIDEHICEDLSMDMVSDHLNISSSHIYRILRSSFNKTFVEYLTEKRLEKACELLQQGVMVKKVADMLGYSSSKYFIHVFKKNKGLSPNQYRSLCRV